MTCAAYKRKLLEIVRRQMLKLRGKKLLLKTNSNKAAKPTLKIAVALKQNNLLLMASPYSRTTQTGSDPDRRAKDEHCPQTDVFKIAGQFC